MKVILDYVNIKIPFFRFVKTEKPPHNLVRNNARVGMIVYTNHCLDVGIVAEVKDGVPTKIYARYETCLFPHCYFPEYGAIDTINWYDSGIEMTIDEWKQLSISTKDAGAFWQYWKDKIEC